jgi:hypothetical protein
MLEISELESISAFWDWVSYIALLLAFIGALIEFIVNQTPLIKSPWWKSKIEKTSAWIVLVTLGVGLIASWKLSTINAQIIAILNKETATAQKDAAEARERVAKAEEGTAIALKKAKEAEMQALKFEASIASSNARAEEAKQLAEREKLERLKLEAQVAPRRLNVEQQKAITASLKGFNGRTVRLATYQFDVDAGLLATQVKPALQQAGILVEDNISRVFLIGGFAVGIHIAGPTAEQDLVKALTESLMRDGKLAAYNRGTTQPPGVVSADKVTVLIGPKPLSEAK